MKGLALGVLLAGLSLGKAAHAQTDVGSVTAPVGIGMLLLSGPITHVGHYRWGAAGASLGLRVGLAVAGAWVGAAVACHGDSCASGPLIGFTALGMLSATAIDAAALSYERLQPSVGVMPTLSIARNRIMLGASSSF